MKKIKQILGFFILVLMALQLQANDIKVINTSIIEKNMQDSYAIVEFDLSWQNSWRVSTAQSNWDAAWVFIKFRVNGEGEWKHAKLAINGHNVGTGTPTQIDLGLLSVKESYNVTSNPALGAFIYRSENSLPAPFSVEKAQLKWDFSSEGIQAIDMLEIKVFAIEMVYVPQGAFYLGSGGNESGRFFRADNPNEPFKVLNENEILTASSGAGNLWGERGITSNGAVSPEDPHIIPAVFPKGFNGFYAMKYSISQQQYVDFLNTLTRAQQNSRTATSLASGVNVVTNRFVMANSPAPLFRNGIACDAQVHPTNPIVFYCDLNNNGIGGEENDGLWIAMNYLAWPDAAAYADWSGLRPMTELEYEKASRGTLVPVANEYAWGSINIFQTNSISNFGTASEIPVNALANSVYGNHSSVQGPFRVGAHATSQSTRESSGASYYGIMGLSGNVWERVVTVANTTGRAFDGRHGDGVLSIAGNGDVPNWPGFQTSDIRNGIGVGARGGSWFFTVTSLQISDRRNAGQTVNSRNNELGFRAVRTAPQQ
jgi:formylglycine-generating enzyme required for sulfatase activity